jgi:hypothetical protein
MTIGRPSIACILLLLPLWSAAAEARLVATFGDVAEFTDFSLHQQSEEATLEVFQRQLERFWTDRLARAVPAGHTLELHFTDIDMAGRIEPLRNPHRPDHRYMETRYPPRLQFRFRLLDAEGDLVREGGENILNPRYGYPPGPGGAVLHQYAFAHEFQILLNWARRTLHGRH